MTAVNIASLAGFAVRCEHLGVTPPKVIARALELFEIANAYQADPVGSVLGLTDKQARDRVADLAIRRHTSGLMATPGMTPGVLEFHELLASEVREAALPELDGLVASLQERFAELAAPLVLAAQEYGFTSSTTSDQVIELADEAASAAWRGARKAWSSIAPVVGLRIDVSKVFEVSPSRAEMTWNTFPRNLGDTPVNYSVAFAAGDNWSLDGGYYLEGRTVGHLDWLALAAGGLRLNTPSEVAAKIAARPAPGAPPLEEILSAYQQAD